MTNPTPIEPTPGEPTKVTRARATTSGVPRRAARPKDGADSTIAAASGSDEMRTRSRSASVPVAEETVRAGNVQIHQGGATNVEADSVSVSQGGVTTARARSIEVRQGGIVHAQADDITVNMGGVALARADRVTVELGGLGIALAREARVTQGAARSIVAQDVRVEQGLVGTMIAAKATFDRPSGVLMLIAGRVEGPIRVLLDWRSALAFGAAFGLLVGIVRRR